MLHFFKNIFDYNDFQIRKYKFILQKIEKEQSEIENMGLDKFPSETKRLQSLSRDGVPNDQILPRAFALVRLAAKKTIGQEHFDTQVMAGIALTEGKIVEQKTGEGKTLTATLPLYFMALVGKGAHLVTVNDYLARIHAGWMGEVFDALGLTTSVIISDNSYIYDKSHADDDAQDIRLRHLRRVTRKEAYSADITYGINSEFGFDYLRDNMAHTKEQLVQRGFHFAIVDEADSVLIDEARTPHIISAPVERDVSKYYQYAKLVMILDPHADYVVDEKLKTVNLTDSGVHRIESQLGVSNIYEKDFDTLFHIEASLKAFVLFKKDKDYIVSDGEVVIVDEFTGRLLHGRRFSEGLHQAIEAKENVAIKQESKTLATVSLQNYFRAYEKLSGMTGTAVTEAEEFTKIYKSDVVVMPTHRPMIRKDLPDMIYKTEKAKFNAVVQEISNQHSVGRPVLVGTTSIEKNEFLSHLLRQKGVPHELLNAKNHEREAVIISRAGEKGAVTVATNMAGRGVDIILGGVDGQNRDEVVSLGGLCVIGTERHESRRIDNQLRGRSGRQGDPGSSQFFVSLEDDLMRIFGGEQITKIMNFLNFPEDQPLSHNMVSKAIESAQKKVEGHNFDIRKHLVEYDDVLSKQREIVYKMRNSLIYQENTSGDALSADIAIRARAVMEDIFANLLQDLKSQNRNELAHRAAEELSAVFGLVEDEVVDIILHAKEDSTIEEIYTLFVTKIKNKSMKTGKDIWNRIVRDISLSTIDNIWTEHLTTIEDLREGINLRGFGQMDPLVEYKNEAYKLFSSLMQSVDLEIVRGITYVEVNQLQKIDQPIENVRSTNLILNPASSKNMFESNSPGIIKPSQTTQIAKKGAIGRNDPCWCGSGKKWKKCHFPQ
jgi:preprotein translocase subunit SecA